MIEINQISNIVEEKSLVLINLKINKKNLLEIQEISAYEFFISDEDNDFIWMGLNKFKIFNTAGEDSEINLNLDVIILPGLNTKLDDLILPDRFLNLVKRLKKITQFRY